MSKTWQRVANVRAFIESRGRVNRGVHSPRSVKGIPWPVCSRCGLVYLRNERTAQAIRSACVVEE